MTKEDVSRNQRKRLRVICQVEEVTHNVAKTCRYFSISSTASYRWKGKYIDMGLAEVKRLMMRPKRIKWYVSDCRRIVRASTSCPNESRSMDFMSDALYDGQKKLSS